MEVGDNIKEDNTGIRIEQLEKQVGSFRSQVVGMKRKGRIRNVSGAVVGAAAVGYWSDGDEIKEFFDGAQEAAHTLNIARKIVTSTEGNSEIVRKYLGVLGEDTSGKYFNDVEEGSSLVDSSILALEGLQRGSLGVPGQEIKPVKGLRDAKGWIIEKTRGLVAGEKGREETAMRNTETYQENYNELARLRAGAIDKKEKLEEEIGSHCRSLQRTELNIGKVDERGLHVLESLVKEHGNATGVLRDISAMKIAEIYQGANGENYNAVIGQARDYQIQPYQPGSWADVGLPIVLGGAAYVGWRTGKAIGSALNLAYASAAEAGKAIGITGRATGRLLRGAKKIVEKALKTRTSKE